MDKLPKVQNPTKEEEKWLMGLDEKQLALMRLAYEKLETSFRPEWCHKWIKDKKAAGKK